MSDSATIRRTYWLEGGLTTASIGFVLGVTSRGDICEGGSGCKLGLGVLLGVLFFFPGMFVGGQIRK